MRHFICSLKQQINFSRPVVKDTEAHIYIKQGRHPVIDHLLPENQQFVPNDTNMSVSKLSMEVVTKRKSHVKPSSHASIVLQKITVILIGP